MVALSRTCRNRSRLCETPGTEQPVRRRSLLGAVRSRLRLWWRRRRNPRVRRRNARPAYRYVRLRWRVLFAVVDCLGEWAATCGRWRRSKLARAGRPVGDESAAEPKVILLVQLDHLGDAVMSTPIFPALRARWPKARIEVLCSPWNREVFAALAEVDVLHVSRRNRFARGGRLGWMVAAVAWGLWLRRRDVDLAIDVRGEFPLALILWLSGARQRLGWRCGGGGFLLTDSPEYLPRRHEVDSRWALLGKLGIQRPAEEMARPGFAPSSRARDRLRRRLANAFGTARRRRPRIVLHVSAGTPAKCWPIAHWRELVSRIVARTEAEIILVGGPGDRAKAAAILQAHRGSGAVDWTGRLTIDELAALVEAADVMVGADSGPAHLAAAVGRPVVTLFSGTNHAPQWKPLGPQVAVLRHPTRCSPCHRRRCPVAGHRCMARLTPERVAAALEPWLSLGASTRPAVSAAAPRAVVADSTDDSREGVESTQLALGRKNS